MKRIMMLAILAVTVMAGCTKEASEADSSKGTLTTFTVNSDSTRTLLQSDKTVAWSSTDQIGVWGGTSSNVIFTAKSVSGTSAVFTGTVASGAATYYAAYPYSASNSMSGTTMSVTVPASQALTAGGFANGVNLSVARTSSRSMTFYNLCGAIRFTLKGTASISKIELTGNNGEVLAGSGSVAMNYASTPALTMTNTTGKTVTLTTASGVTLNSTGTAYCFVLAPVTFTKGFTIKFYDISGYTMTVMTTKSVAVQRARLLNITSAITYTPSSKIPTSSEYVYYGKANCVLMNNGATSATLDVKPYVSTTCKMQTSDPVADVAYPSGVKLVWRESALTFTPSLSGTTLSITGASGYGNAVVGITDASGNIMWSYHIWRPESNATVTKAYTVTNSGTYNVMPLALGATKVALNTSDDATKIAACGLYYQWGRKDPLGRASNLTGAATFVGAVDATGTAVSWTSAAYQVAQSSLTLPTSGKDRYMISYTILNPARFITVASGVNNNDWVVTASNNLWANQTGFNNPTQNSYGKAIFDPCPSGYRVAPKDLWVNFTTTKANSINTAEWNASSVDESSITAAKGMNFYYAGTKTGDTDFYPFSGMRAYDGSLQSNSTNGYCWSNSPFTSANNTVSSSFWFFAESVSPMARNNRVSALTVRCVAY